MSGKISDLTDHLFAQLDKLSNAKSAEAIETEVARTKAIVAVAEQITEGAHLQVKAAELFGKFGPAVVSHLPMIGKAVEK